MRTPLIVLICAYAVSVLGFVLIPGQDANGEPWRMDFFHAFYFVSFMGSTIGFGEIPYPFTGSQRMWTLFTIYATVISWLYAIGNLIALIQTPLFRSAITRNSFVKKVKQIKQPFFLVCGYGDTGKILVEALSHHDRYCVVIDKEQTRINELDLETLPYHVATLHGDASDSETLVEAGLKSPFCSGVVAVTRSGEVNLKVAIAAKLLNPDLTVYCWAETRDIGLNMESFGTDHIINPYEIFARHLSMALSSPSQHLLREWLSSPRRTWLSEPVFPPKGLWVICGYGRFGKAIEQSLLGHGLQVRIIESDPEQAQPPEGSIIGRGTEADTLLEAGIEGAVGIIAGTDHDVNNLSIILTAKALKPDLFTIARQEFSANNRIFQAADIDIVTHHSKVIASSLLSMMTTPLTSSFLTQAQAQSEEWARNLISRLLGCVDEHNPDSWVITLNPNRASAIFELYAKGGSVELHHLMRSPDKRKIKLPCVPLLLHRRTGDILLPDEKTKIFPYDRILFAGDYSARASMLHIGSSADVLHYTITGENRPTGYFWNWLTRKFFSKSPDAPSATDN